MARRPGMFSDQFLNSDAVPRLARLKNISLLGDEEASELGIPDVSGTAPSPLPPPLPMNQPFEDIRKMQPPSQIENRPVVAPTEEYEPESFNPVTQALQSSTSPQETDSSVQPSPTAVDTPSNYMQPEEPSIFSDKFVYTAPNAQDIAPPPQSPTAVDTPSNYMQPEEPSIFSDRFVYTPESVIQQINEKSKTQPQYTYSQPGSIDLVQQVPDAYMRMSEIYGGPIPQEDLEGAKLMEKALNDEIAAKDELAAALRKKVDAKDLTTKEKVWLGVALLAPSIIGGFFGGPEAFFKGAGNTLSMFGKEMADEENEKRDALSKLSSLAYQKSDSMARQLKAQNNRRALEKENTRREDLKSRLSDSEKLDLNREILAAIPDESLRSELQNREVRKFTDGTTSEIGISTRDPDLYINAKSISSPEDIKEFRNKVLPSATKYKDLVMGGNKILDDMLYILDQLKDQGRFSSFSGSLSPVFQQDVTLPDGRKMTAGAAFKQLDEYMSDKYNKFQGYRARTGNVEKHWRGMIEGPYSKPSLLTGNDMKTVTGQVQELKRIMNRSLLDDLRSQGFVTTPIKRELDSSPFQKRQEEERVARLLAQDAKQKMRGQ